MDAGVLGVWSGWLLLGSRSLGISSEFGLIVDSLLVGILRRLLWMECRVLGTAHRLLWWSELRVRLWWCWFWRRTLGRGIVSLQHGRDERKYNGCSQHVCGPDGDQYDRKPHQLQRAWRYFSAADGQRAGGDARSPCGAHRRTDFAPSECEQRSQSACLRKSRAPVDGGYEFSKWYAFQFSGSFIQ